MTVDLQVPWGPAPPRVRPMVAVNAEVAVRDWLREQPDVAAVVGRRIFIGVPPELSRGEDSYPLVGVHRLPSPLDPYLPVDHASLQLDCWGPMKSQRAAHLAAAVVASALWKLVEGTALTGEVRALGTSNITIQWLPDPVSDRPRYITQATIDVVNTT